jgi:hypothetical protein
MVDKETTLAQYEKMGKLGEGTYGSHYRTYDLLTGY